MGELSLLCQQSGRKRPRSSSGHDRAMPCYSTKAQKGCSVSVNQSNSSSSQASWNWGGSPINPKASPRSLPSHNGAYHAKMPKVDVAVVATIVENRVHAMFDELDVLLQAEKINRRVMRRWSGLRQECTSSSDSNAEGSQEAQSNYCTWGLELIRQGVQDTLVDIKATMSSGDIESAVDAMLRLVAMYMLKSEERNLPETRQDMHVEILSELGNAWFALLPSMSKDLRSNFLVLVAGMEKKGELVVPFRCAQTIASIDLSGSFKESKEVLESLLGPDVYNCDAYICLWRMADTLALRNESRSLATEYRLKSLDAEMWRSLLQEENLARQHGLDDDEDEDEEGEEKPRGDEESVGRGHAMEVDEEASAAEHHSHHTTTTTRQEETTTTTTPILTTPPRPKSPQDSPSDKPTQGSCGSLTASPTAEKNSSLQTIAPDSAPLPEDWQAWNGSRGDGEEGEEEEDEEEVSHAGPDVNMYADFFTRRRHQYRAVISYDFRKRVMVCLEDMDAPPATNPTLLARSRPLLHRLLALLPMEDIPTMLELVAAKFSYDETLHLLTPLLMETEEGRALSLVTISRAMDWALDYDNGRGLVLITRHHLPLIDSPQLLQRMARRAVKYGRDSVPFILRSLTAIPPRLYEPEALELARLMGDNWSKEDLLEYGHLLIVRSLQHQPSLSLYFALKKHVLPDDDSTTSTNAKSGVQRVLELMDPTGDLSIGIRLAEGLTSSALDSLSYSLISTPDNRGPERAFFWFSFTVQGLKEGRLSSEVLSQLITNESFKNAVFEGLAVEGNEETKCRQLLVSCFTKLHELAPTQPEVVVTACQLLLSHYARFENIRKNDSSMLGAVAHVLKAAGKTSSFLGDMMKSLSGSATTTTTTDMAVDVMAS